MTTMTPALEHARWSLRWSPTPRQQLAIFYVTAWTAAVAMVGREQAHRLLFVRKARGLYRQWCALR